MVRRRCRKIIKLISEEDFAISILSDVAKFDANDFDASPSDDTYSQRKRLYCTNKASKDRNPMAQKFRPNQETIQKLMM